MTVGLVLGIRTVGLENRVKRQVGLRTVIVVTRVVGRGTTTVRVRWKRR